MTSTEFAFLDLRLRDRAIVTSMGSERVTIAFECSQ